MNLQILRALTAAIGICSACASGSLTPTMPAGPREETLVSVQNSTAIDGAPEAVFDLVTTARFWPQWHPATTGVSGVTERPYLLGDRIIEAGRIGKGEFQVTWQVAEHVRGRRIVLQAEGSPVRIAYSFNPRGNLTEFTRELKYHVEDLKSISTDPNEVNRLMRAQSEQAVKQLKTLVEKILRAEKIEPQ
ncbi:MAG TPA: SRPBCC family protein [Candidatus Binatia bacterium]|nr:SRPBCC family protein [Candidatus Binatia bacterium]